MLISLYRSPVVGTAIPHLTNGPIVISIGILSSTPERFLAAKLALRPFCEPRFNINCIRALDDLLRENEQAKRREAVPYLLSLVELRQEYCYMILNVEKLRLWNRENSMRTKATLCFLRLRGQFVSLINDDTF